MLHLNPYSPKFYGNKETKSKPERVAELMEKGKTAIEAYIIVYGDVPVIVPPGTTNSKPKQNFAGYIC